MKLMEWINGVTKLNKATMEQFQNNIKEATEGTVLYENTAGKTSSFTIDKNFNEYTSLDVYTARSNNRTPRTYTSY